MYYSIRVHANKVLGGGLEFHERESQVDMRKWKYEHFMVCMYFSKLASIILPGFFHDREDFVGAVVVYL
jgi:hypothetical protein